MASRSPILTTVDKTLYLAGIPGLLIIVGIVSSHPDRHLYWVAAAVTAALGAVAVATHEWFLQHVPYGVLKGVNAGLVIGSAIAIGPWAETRPGGFSHVDGGVMMMAMALGWLAVGWWWRSRRSTHG